MKIALGSKIYDKPWGGGNLFIKNLSEYLISNGHEVVFSLNDSDVDLVLLMDPRTSSEGATFNHNDIARYKRLVKSNVVVVQRINECDQRKDTKGVNEFYLKSNSIADHTVFVSKWLKNIYKNEGFEGLNYSIIMSGSDISIFNNSDFQEWKSGEKFKIVTHHWGNNRNKGFEVYQKLDSLLNEKYWNELIEFQFIGNLNEEYQFYNTKITEPLSGLELAKEIKKNNAYITGSINEPSGNHHIESSQCGLPLLYLNSGGIPEFANDYGLEYEIDNFEEKIQYLIDNYSHYFKLMKKYPFSSKNMSMEYEELFLDLLDKNKKNNQINSSIYKFIFFVLYRIKYFFKFNFLGKYLFQIYLKVKFIMSRNKINL